MVCISTIIKEVWATDAKRKTVDKSISNFSFFRFIYSHFKRHTYSKMHKRQSIIMIGIVGSYEILVITLALHDGHVVSDHFSQIAHLWTNLIVFNWLTKYYRRIFVFIWFGRNSNTQINTLDLLFVCASAVFVSGTTAGNWDMVFSHNLQYMSV